MIPANYDESKTITIHVSRLVHNAGCREIRTAYFQKCVYMPKAALLEARRKTDSRFV
jgi:hypothetical protein